MKETFFNLGEDKKQRVIDASLIEFASAGYEKTSLDAVIARAGISKGGLYEYIESKKDLFTYILTYAYDELFSYIQKNKPPERIDFPADPLERTRSISSIAVDFYIQSPQIISFLVTSSQVGDISIRLYVQEIFSSYFYRLYETSDFALLPYDRDQILDLLKWLLVKTRNVFQESVQSGGEKSACKKRYLNEWNFYLSVLAKGMYQIER